MPPPLLVETSRVGPHRLPRRILSRQTCSPWLTPAIRRCIIDLEHYVLQRWFLLADLWSAWAFVWLLGLGRLGLTLDDHRFFADRYERLADHHRKRGNLAQAARLDEKVREHRWIDDPDEPPHAAAMAMPRPRPYVRTDAVTARISNHQTMPREETVTDSL